MVVVIDSPCAIDITSGEILMSNSGCSISRYTVRAAERLPDWPVIEMIDWVRGAELSGRNVTSSDPFEASGLRIAVTPAGSGDPTEKFTFPSNPPKSETDSSVEFANPGRANREGAYVVNVNPGALTCTIIAVEADCPLEVPVTTRR